MKTTVCEEDTAEGRLQKRVVLFPFVEGDIPLALDDLIYIETYRHKNLFYTKNGVFSIYRKLNEIETELNGMGFLRIHQSFLVNMQYIGKISSYLMTLTTGKELSVPKARYPNVKKQYQQFQDLEKKISCARTF